MTRVSGYVAYKIVIYCLCVAARANVPASYSHEQHRLAMLSQLDSQRATRRRLAYTTFPTNEYPLQTRLVDNVLQRRRKCVTFWLGADVAEFGGRVG